MPPPPKDTLYPYISFDLNKPAKRHLVKVTRR